MSTITIKTNNIPRELLSGWDLTEEERQELDYIADPGDLDAWSEQINQFFRYRGEIYSLDQFSRIIPPGSKRCHPMECQEPAFQGWHGYASDSYFSGMLVRIVDDGESVIVGSYLS